MLYIGREFHRMFPWWCPCGHLQRKEATLPDFRCFLLDMWSSWRFFVNRTVCLSLQLTTETPSCCRWLLLPSQYLYRIVLHAHCIITLNFLLLNVPIWTKCNIQYFYLLHFEWRISPQRTYMAMYNWVKQQVLFGWQAGYWMLNWEHTPI